MLTCDSVRDRLSVLAVGEDPDEALREHVAACEACRAEREVLLRDVEDLRAGLASLSPSPFLEDAVLRAVRELDPADRTPSRRHLWAGAGIAAVAAVVLFAVFAGIRTGVFDRRAGPTDVVAWVAPPPSAAAVDAARRAHDPAGDPPIPPAGAMIHDPDGTPSAVFLPPSERTSHRWVYGDEQARPGPRRISMGAPPRPGVMLLGSGLLARMGDVTLSGGKGLVLERGDRVWRAIGGTSEAEITLGAPYPGGPEARVRVLISTGYAGELLLEEPLARALDLHHFEIPGGFAIEGTAYAGQRARARVKVPELDVDVVVEVQVLGPQSADADPAPTPPRVPLQRGTRVAELRASGSPPTSEGSIVRTTLERDGSRAILWSDPRVARMGGAEGGSTPWLDAGADFPPGARILASRVWQGRTAVPSGESVVFAEADASGRLRLPRLSAEEGSTLRLLVIPPTGEPVFRDLDLAPLAEADAEVRVAGDDVSVAVRLSTRPGGDQVTWTVPGGLTAENRWLLDEIGRWLETAIDREGLRRPDGTVALRLVLLPDVATRWNAVARLLLEAVRNDVHRIRFGTADGAAAVDQDLPRDADLPARERPRITARLLPTAEGTPQVAVATSSNERGFAIARMGPPDAAEGMLRDALRGRPGAEGLILVPPTPGSEEIRYADVFRLLQAMRKAGIAPIRFSAAATPESGR